MLDLEQVARAIDDAAAPVTADEARARAGARTHFRRTAVLASACAVLLAAGAIFGAFVALGLGRHSTSVLVRGNETTTTVGRSTPVEQHVPLGTPIGRIVIPEIDVDWVFVEGSRPQDEAKGPMHSPDSPMPGEDGNVVITGHRTTYGAPFLRLNELKPGDVIQITTLSGGFTYVVDRNPFVVAPEGDQLTFLDLLGCRNGTRSLTLITYAPKYSRAQRLVVTAHMGTQAVRSCAR
jgi:sortase A